MLEKIPLNIKGMTVKIRKDLIRKYTQYKVSEWVPRKNKKVPRPVLPGTSLNNEIQLIGYGAVRYLKASNPEFASRIEITEFPSSVHWKPLDVNTLYTPENPWRPPQMKAIETCAKSMIGNVVAGMALGKTDIMVAIAYMAAATGWNVLFISPTLKTQDNFFAKASKQIKNLYRYEQVRNLKEIPSGIVVVSSAKLVVDGVSSGVGFKFLATVGTLLVDEAHNFFKTEWVKLPAQLPSLHRMFGFSATSIPSEYDKNPTFSKMPAKIAETINACGPVIYRVEHEEYEQYIDVPELIEIPHEWDGVDTIKLENTRNWRIVKEKCRVNSARNKLIVDVIRELIAANRTAVVPINDKSRITKFMTVLNDDKVIMWLGDNKIYDNAGRLLKVEETEQGLANGKYLTVFATSHLSEGWDVPSLNAILLTEGKDRINTQQRSGRVIRRSTTTPIIVNIMDSVGVLKYQSESRSADLIAYYRRSPHRLNSTTELRDYLCGNL